MSYYQKRKAYTADGVYGSGRKKRVVEKGPRKRLDKGSTRKKGSRAAEKGPRKKRVVEKGPRKARLDKGSTRKTKCYTLPCEHWYRAAAAYTSPVNTGARLAFYINMILI